MFPVPDRRHSPRELVGTAAELVGRDLVVRWCEELLAGRAEAGDPDWPDIAWLGGTVGWVDYWARVWGARGLMHLGPARPEIVLAALDDDAWRVREMALKVIRHHDLDDTSARIEALVDDPVERVRTQAWMALGRPGPPPGAR